MKLVYWVAACLDDSAVYSIRAKTRKECKAKLNAKEIDPEGYDPPVKVEIEYSDAFDLAIKLLEGHYSPA